METGILIVGVALPAAALLFLFGWLVGFDSGCNMSNWGTGYEDGWNAYKELVIDTRRANHGLDKPESSD